MFHFLSVQLRESPAFIPRSIYIPLLWYILLLYLTPRPHSYISLLYPAPIFHSYIPFLYPAPISHSYIPLLYPLLDSAPISHPVYPTPYSIPCIFYFVYALLFHSVCTHSICVPILVNFLSIYSTLCMFYSLRDSHSVFYSLCTFLFVCRTKGVGHE